MYVSIYGGALSLFVKFSRTKKIVFVKFHVIVKIRKIWKIEKLREPNGKNEGKKRSSKNDTKAVVFGLAHHRLTGGNPLPNPPIF